MNDAFGIMFQAAKDEIWFEQPSKERVIEIVGEVIRNVETGNQMKRLKEFFNFKEVCSYRDAVLEAYGDELNQLEEDLSKAVR